VHSTLTSQLFICCRTWIAHVLHANERKTRRQSREGEKITWREGAWLLSSAVACGGGDGGWTRWHYFFSPLLLPCSFFFLALFFLRFFYSVFLPLFLSFFLFFFYSFSPLLLIFFYHLLSPFSPVFRGEKRRPTPLLNQWRRGVGWTGRPLFSRPSTTLGTPLLP